MGLINHFIPDEQILSQNMPIGNIEVIRNKTGFGTADFSSNSPYSG